MTFLDAIVESSYSYRGKQLEEVSLQLSELNFLVYIDIPVMLFNYIMYQSLHELDRAPTTVLEKDLSRENSIDYFHTMR